MVSETSDNFISNLRISVTPISATPSESTQGFKAFDVAFLHDVVARAAQLEWLPVPWTNDRPNLEHAPSRWSYRSVSSENELKSTTFLTRSEEHTSELQSLMRISYAVFCLKKKNTSNDSQQSPPPQT